MSHPEQLAFLRLCAEANRELVRGGQVLEIGSYDVNGTVRPLFSEAAGYVGVDLVSGPGVDVVSFGHEFSAPDASFDVALSGECFEHDPHWVDTFTNMVRLTRPGGLVAFTCASTGRVEHGTVRSTAIASPGTHDIGLDYYANLAADDFKEMPLGEWFSTHAFWTVGTSRDLYFAGTRAGADNARLPDAAKVRAIQRMMPLWQRAATAPLWAWKRISRSEEQYQEWAVRYVRSMRMIADRVIPDRATRVDDTRKHVRPAWRAQ